MKLGPIFFALQCSSVTILQKAPPKRGPPAPGPRLLCRPTVSPVTPARRAGAGREALHEPREGANGRDAFVRVERIATVKGDILGLVRGRQQEKHKQLAFFLLTRGAAFQ
jgi:hypothetical protein